MTNDCPKFLSIRLDSHEVKWYMWNVDPRILASFHFSKLGAFLDRQEVWDVVTYGMLHMSEKITYS
jgi:hypothetical protein